MGVLHLQHGMMAYGSISMRNADVSRGIDTYMGGGTRTSGQG